MSEGEKLNILSNLSVEDIIRLSNIGNPNIEFPWIIEMLGWSLLGTSIVFLIFLLFVLAYQIIKL